MTTANDAKEIRVELKNKFGYTSRQVSVRSNNYSMGSSIYVTIRDLTIDLKPVEEIAKGIAEHVRRCESTGEILGGGNRYVFVKYDYTVLDAAADPYRGIVNAWPENGRSVEIFPGVELCIPSGQSYPIAFYAFADGNDQRINKESVASYIALQAAQRNAKPKLKLFTN